MATAPKDAEPSTNRANAAVRAALPFDDQGDFADAARGLVAPLPDGVVRAASGSVLWNLRDYDFLAKEEAPDTVNPSLWRLARLNRVNGLFEVMPRLYQLRGLDIANMTIVEGDSGIIVIDTLTTCEAARAALDLYYAHRPRRPIAAVIYTHSHVDHFGGVKGIVEEEAVRAGMVPIIAPDGFMAAVGGENVLAGLPMVRRAQYQFGNHLPRGPRHQVDAGIGKAMGRGTVSLIAPTELVAGDGERRTIDGVEFVFQLAPETEAPAEMHLYLPQFRALNLAENATRCLHNFIPLRGAAARDPLAWSRALGWAVAAFGDRTDVLIGQHHWPTWGRERVATYLARQRDLYKHIHDQSLRLINRGYRPGEVAEALSLPAGLDHEWSVRGYYGTLSHNSKAVYQRYLSWYDGNPANLNPLPPVAAAKKAIAYMGGAAAVLARASEDFRRGEYRWVAQIASQLVFAEPDNRAARALAADAFEQLGYQAESATWRNAYLFGAQELRDGVMPAPPRPPVSPDLLSGVATETLFDYLAIRLDPAKATGRHWRVVWHLSDTGETVTQNLENATLTQMPGTPRDAADATIETGRAVLAAASLRPASLAEAIAAGTCRVTGDIAKVTALIAMLDEFALMFDIVTPSPRE